MPAGYIPCIHGYTEAIFHTDVVSSYNTSVSETGAIRNQGNLYNFANYGCEMHSHS